MTKRMFFAWMLFLLCKTVQGESEKGITPTESRHYAAMVIDGDDLDILSRSGDSRAQCAHNVNLITFHKVKNFRDLVY